jgi:hypothetical protein
MLYPVSVIDLLPTSVSKARCEAVVKTLMLVVSGTDGPH